MVANTTCEWDNRLKKLHDSFNADDAELSALKYESAVIDVSLLDETITEEGFDDLDSSAEGIERSLLAETQKEDIVGGAAYVISERIQDLGSLYPFEKHNGTIKLKSNSEDTNYWPYVFCLLSSTAEASKKKTKIRACFELIALETLRAFLGDGTHGMRTGFPWNVYSSGKHKVAKDVFEALQSSCGDSRDWKWSPRNGVSTNPSHQRAKDLGVDVVVWKPMPDKKGGNAYMCGQCATGRSDIDSKSADLNYIRLADFLKVPDCPPFKSLVTPHDIPSTEHIREICRLGGTLVFDRTRIVRLISNYNSINPSHKKDMIELINSELERELFDAS